MPLRTDEALMLAYQQGDAAAFDELYRRWRIRLLRYLTCQCGNSTRAEELYQDVWLKIIGARTQYEVTAKFSTWLFRIAHNRLIDYWRKCGREAAEILASYENEDDFPETDFMAQIPAASEQQPERRVEQRELGEKMLAAISTLPAAQRETFLLVEEGEMTLEEIASTMGSSRETAKSRLRYALNKLRAELKEWR